jgi:malate dehydrogenase (oxaloacetate-decarboxylating)(NADP+)
MAAYRERLQRFVFRSGLLMKPVFDAAARAPRRVVYAEGEAERVLHCAQQALQMGIAEPILVGDTARITENIRSLGLTIRPGEDVTIADPAKVDAEAYAADLHGRVGRSGVSAKEALRGVRADPTVLACLMLARGEADAAICGSGGRFGHHLKRLEGILGRREGVRALSTLNAMVLPQGTIFIADAYVNLDPSPEETADLTELAAETMRRMGVTPRAALVSHANFGDRPSASSQKMRRAMEILRARNPDFEVDGEMHADAALDPRLRARAYAHSSLTGAANLLIMPNADTAHVALNLLKVLGGGTPVGPILMGAGKPAHIASQSVTVRGLLNLTAIAVVEAQAATREEIREAAE